LYDVAVVGGGPVGSYVAYKLAGWGYKVVVLERKEKLGEQVCCTGIISQECVNSLAINNNVILRQINSARLFSPSGRLLRLWRQEAQACIVDRGAFDMAVASMARGKGVEYVLNSLVRDIEVKDNRVSVEAMRLGERLSFEARVAVIATGFGSKISEGLGLGKASDFVMGTQAEVETIGVDEVEVFFGQDIAPGFFAWLVPTSPSKALVGLLSRRSPGFHLKKLMSALLAEGKIASTEAKISYGGIPLKPLTKTCRQRIIVVGDAAGQVKPTTGGGIYYGLLCADIAANTLQGALENGDLSAKGLASYERQWRRMLGRELKIGYYARKFYERLSNRHIDRMFEIIKSNGIDEALLKAEDLSFDWHGEAVLRLLGQGAISKALNMMKIPFHLGESG